MKLTNTTYDKIKIIYKLSKTSHFISKHAIPEATQSGDRELIDILIKSGEQLDSIVEQLKNLICRELQ